MIHDTKAKTNINASNEDGINLAVCCCTLMVLIFAGTNFRDFREF